MFQLCICSSAPDISTSHPHQGTEEVPCLLSSPKSLIFAYAYLSPFAVAPYYIYYLHGLKSQQGLLLLPKKDEGYNWQCLKIMIFIIKSFASYFLDSSIVHPFNSQNSWW